MHYYYCDTCAVINLYKANDLIKLSKYKDNFHIADLQLEYELLYPDGIKELTRNSITVDITTMDILNIANQIMEKHRPLSKFDALALSFSITKEYVLITDDIKLQKACKEYDVHYITTREIVEIFIEK